jgi:hypothetical protein
VQCSASVHILLISHAVHAGQEGFDATGHSLDPTKDGIDVRFRRLPAVAIRMRTVADVLRVRRHRFGRRLAR